jgi:hypothetical protein
VHSAGSDAVLPDAITRLDRVDRFSCDPLDKPAAQALTPVLGNPANIGGDQLELQTRTPRVEYENVHRYLLDRSCSCSAMNSELSSARPRGLGYLLRPFPAGNVRLISAVPVSIVPARNLLIEEFLHGVRADSL